MRKRYLLYVSVIIGTFLAEWIFELSFDIPSMLAVVIITCITDRINYKGIDWNDKI